jgi:uncharacterized membrane protein
VVLGYLFVFVIPGVALTAVLFPRVRRESSTRFEVRQLVDTNAAITTTERAVVSLGLSFVVVPLIGLLLNFLPVGVRLFTIVPAIAALSLVLSSLGLIRRFRLPPEDRFGISVGTLVADLRRWINGPESGTERLFNLVLVVGLVLAATGIAYAVVAPPPGERFTEFYLQTADPETGELVADDYPSELDRGDQATIHVGLTNQEHQTVSYTVVAEIQRFDGEGNESRQILRRQIDQFSVTVEHGESWQREHTVSPSIYGDHIRLTYLLYKGAPPSTPTVENSYRSVHIWLEVG